jgi:hypothetical protein
MSTLDYREAIGKMNYRILTAVQINTSRLTHILFEEATSLGKPLGALTSKL